MKWRCSSIFIFWAYHFIFISLDHSFFPTLMCGKENNSMILYDIKPTLPLLYPFLLFQLPFFFLVLLPLLCMLMFFIFLLLVLFSVLVFLLFLFISSFCSCSGPPPSCCLFLSSYCVYCIDVTKELYSSHWVSLSVSLPQWPNVALQLEQESILSQNAFS